MPRSLRQEPERESGHEHTGRLLCEVPDNEEEGRGDGPAPGREIPQYVSAGQDERDEHRVGPRQVIKGPREAEHPGVEPRREQAHAGIARLTAGASKQQPERPRRADQGHASGNESPPTSSASPATSAG